MYRAMQKLYLDIYLTISCFDGVTILGPQDLPAGPPARRWSPHPSLTIGQDPGIWPPRPRGPPAMWPHYCSPSGGPGKNCLLFYCSTVLLYYCITVLLYYCFTFLLYYCFTVLLSFRITVYCFTDLLLFWSTVLLIYCSTVFCFSIYCSTILHPPFQLVWKIYQRERAKFSLYRLHTG